MMRKIFLGSTEKKFDGFTLIEVIIVVALVGILMVAITEFFLGSSQIYNTQSAELGVNYSARLALDDIDAYVRQAVQVLDSYGVYNSGATTLILQVQSVDSSNQLIPGTFDTIIFNLSGTSLTREIIPGSGSVRLSGTRTVGENISNLTFAYNNASFALVDLVTISMVITKNAGRTTQDITISSQAHLRN